MVVLKGARSIVAGRRETFISIPREIREWPREEWEMCSPEWWEAFWLRGFPPLEAAKLGVYLHGLVGDFVAYRRGERGMGATDLIEETPRMLRALADGCGQVDDFSFPLRMEVLLLTSPMIEEDPEEGMWEVLTKNPDQTLRLGRVFGELLPQASMVALIGDLGAGKTILAKGIARGLGVEDEREVSSPTFRPGQRISGAGSRIPCGPLPSARIRRSGRHRLGRIYFRTGSDPGGVGRESAGPFAGRAHRSSPAWVGAEERRLFFVGKGRSGQRFGRAIFARNGWRRSRVALIVQKYGGTSVGDLIRIRNVARRVAKTRQEGNDVVVVVSAMSGETDRLIQLAHQACENPDLREYDALISTGEQVSVALLAITLQSMGVPAKSFLGPQVRILTDSAFSKARIQEVEVRRLQKELKAGMHPGGGRLPGGGQRREYHHPGPRRVGYHRSGPGGGPEGGCLRDLHGCGRGLYHRPEHLPGGAQAIPHHL